MSVFLLHNWGILNNEIGDKLETSPNTINDLYSVLLNTYIDKLKTYFFEEDGRTLEEIDKFKKIYFNLLDAANDSDQNRTRNEFYRAPTPPTEMDAVTIVEGYYEYLLESNDKLAEEYIEYLEEFLMKYNIRYRLCPSCKLTLTLQGLLWTQLDFIKYFALISGSQPRIECIKMLEHHLDKIEARYEENYCIEDSIKLIEHFLYEKTSQSTLGQALDQSNTMFPSNLAKDSLRKYYEFSNKHPNLRHIGSYEPPIRNLNKSDGLLALSLAIVYSAFIIQNPDAILYGKYIKHPEEIENDLFSTLF